jgi:hypothetical protein
MTLSATAALYARLGEANSTDIIADITKQSESAILTLFYAPREGRQKTNDHQQRRA